MTNKNPKIYLFLAMAVSMNSNGLNQKFDLIDEKCVEQAVNKSGRVIETRTFSKSNCSIDGDFVICRVSFKHSNVSEKKLFKIYERSATTLVLRSLDGNILIQMDLASSTFYYSEIYLINLYPYIFRASCSGKIKPR